MTDKIASLVSQLYKLSTEEIFKAIVIYEMSYTGVQLNDKDIEMIYQYFKNNDYYSGILDEELKDKIVENYS
ncbi:hypothetical protein CW670_10940 [Macrococcoides caseolyticum]|uniref:hypothetical protein n=1 Tax=Macrococcoides caseolyticum TaxID=69966 RepID=UPI000C33D591|nr:hypothetical protein [Macrococcus caseolyticus]PKE73647.1 hypothetical protein CW670_10940 [Macrococcus caseolyticus]